MLANSVYNSGGRASELTYLKRNQIFFGTQVYLQLMGKVHKKCTIPLWPLTARTLKAWFAELSDMSR